MFNTEPDWGRSGHTENPAAQRTETTQAVITQETNCTSSQEDRNRIAQLQPEIQIPGDENEPAAMSAIRKVFGLASGQSTCNEVDQAVRRAQSALKDLDVQLVTLPHDIQVAYLREAVKNAGNCSDELAGKKKMLCKILQDAEKEWETVEKVWEKKRDEIESLVGCLSQTEAEIRQRVDDKASLLDLARKINGESLLRERGRTLQMPQEQRPEERKRRRGDEEPENQHGGSKRSKRITLAGTAE